MLNGRVKPTVRSQAEIVLGIIINRPVNKEGYPEWSMGPDSIKWEKPSGFPSTSRFVHLCQRFRDECEF